MSLIEIENYQRILTLYKYDTITHSITYSVYSQYKYITSRGVRTSRLQVPYADAVYTNTGVIQAYVLSTVLVLYLYCNSSGIAILPLRPPARTGEYRYGIADIRILVRTQYPGYRLLVRYKYLRTIVLYEYEYRVYR